MPYLNVGIHPDPEDFANAEVVIQAHDDGHIATVIFPLPAAGGSARFQASGEGSRVLVEGLRLLADKVEQAHTEWLRTKAAEQ